MSENNDKIEIINEDICSYIEKNIPKDNNTFESSLEKINNIFTQIYNKLDEINQNKEQKCSDEFSRSFEELKKNQIDEINNSIKIKDSNYIHLAKILNSQIILYNFLGEVFLEKYVNIKDGDIFNIMNNITNNIILNYNTLANMTVKLMENIEIINEEINNLNMEIDKKDNYIKQLNDKNNLLQEKLCKNQQDDEIISIKLLNNKTNNKIIEPYRDKLLYKTNKLYSKYILKSTPPKNINYSNDINKKIYFSDKIVKQNNLSYKNIISNNPINNQNISFTDLTNLFLKGNRIFTIKMLKDIINNLYNSKNIFNNKCTENKQPKETMEEYMYTYFNYKYGLNNMVIEWATNIINGIKNFSQLDSEICLFGKILRNDLDESCQYIMPKLMKNINDTITKILKKEYQFKSNEEISEYKNKVIKNRLTLNLVQMILDNIYTKNEQEKIITQITEAINVYKYKLANNENIDNDNDILYRNKLTRIELNQKLLEKESESNSISYNEFINICHKIEVNKREDYLKSLIDIFKSNDKDNDGILDEIQFIDFVKELNIFDENNLDNAINELLNIIDPYGFKKFIFTDCVEFFLSYNINNKNVIDIINEKKGKC